MTFLEPRHGNGNKRTTLASGQPHLGVAVAQVLQAALQVHLAGRDQHVLARLLQHHLVLGKKKTKIL